MPRDDKQYMRGNHWLTLTLTPGAMAGAIGSSASDSWKADGPYAFALLNCSELGTGDTVGFAEFELEVKAAGVKWQNLPVSARALSADGKGRRFADLLEGRVLLVDRGDVIEAVFTKATAGSITPKLHLIGHRGWPEDFQQRGQLLSGEGRPYFHVVRDPADTIVNNGATSTVNQTVNLCLSMSRVAFADRLTTTGNRLEFDAVVSLSQGAVQTLGSLAVAANRRMSLRALCAEQGLDLRELLGGFPQVLQDGDQFSVDFLNDSGSNLYPRLIYMGHEGLPFGPADLFGSRNMPAAARPPATPENVDR